MIAPLQQLPAIDQPTFHLLPGSWKSLQGLGVKQFSKQLATPRFFDR
jgi:hypothetical protein